MAELWEGHACWLGHILSAWASQVASLSAGLSVKRLSFWIDLQALYLSGCQGRNRMSAWCPCFLYLHSVSIQHILPAGRQDMHETEHDVISRCMLPAAVKTAFETAYCIQTSTIKTMQPLTIQAMVF
eukprot:134264-Chlamydomonas_euryale.AAC.5